VFFLITFFCGFFCLMQLGVQNEQLQHQQQQLLPCVGFKIFFWKDLDVGAGRLFFCFVSS
jgi:hypothetical protein